MHTDTHAREREINAGSTAHDASPEDHAKVWSLAKKIRVAMMTTKGDMGLAARPMYAVVEDEDGLVWFVTDRHSGKVDEIEKNGEALLTFSNGSDGDHVVMGGTLTVVDDRTKLEDVWNIGADTYYPKGPKDPEAILLRFDPDHAEYWTGGSGIVTFAVSYVKAKVTGERPDMGKNAKVAM